VSSVEDRCFLIRTGSERASERAKVRARARARARVNPERERGGGGVIYM